MKKNLARELFEMVYQWGRVGIVVDENCPAYESLLSQIKKDAVARYVKRQVKK